MLNLKDMMDVYQEDGLTIDLAAARVCQDIVLTAISKGPLNRNVTIKGGVVMRSITNNNRRATRDIDLDFVETGRIHVSDESIDIICAEFPINKVWLTTGAPGDMFATGHSVPAVKVDTVGDRVKEVRRLRNLSQSRLAKLIDCSAIHISFVEVVRVKPSNDLLNRISLKCEVNEQWLLSGVGDPEDIDAESKVDDELIGWLNDHPEIVLELRNRKRFGV